jgi:hypothetical protein
MHRVELVKEATGITEFFEGIHVIRKRGGDVSAEPTQLVSAA